MEVYHWGIRILLVVDCILVICINARTRKDRREFCLYLSELLIRISFFKKNGMIIFRKIIK